MRTHDEIIVYTKIMYGENSVTMPSNVQKHVLLAPYTTLGVGGFAEYFVQVHSTQELTEVVSWATSCDLNITILGGGSNVLIADEGISGLVMQPCFTGIHYEDVEEGVTLVRVGAGVLLDALVEDVVSHGLWGLENLSAIPGTVGATPVQNVGAYGVEVKDVIVSVTMCDITTQKIFEIKNEACKFSYRDSIFKREEGKNFCIIEVAFLLHKKASPKISYKDLTTYFLDTTEPTLREIRNAVIEIRSNKFPDWHIVGTAGSFFKNPTIAKDVFMVLQLKYPDIVGYNNEQGDIKISLGWILEHVCKVKGVWEGKVGLFEKQALVLVCERGVTAEEIKNFSEKIIARVYDATGIRIEREVTLLQ